MKHGTRRAIADGCECDGCRLMARVYATQDAAKPKPQRVRRAQHGTRSRYNAGCRCEPCTESNRAYERARTFSRVSDAAPYRAVLLGVALYLDADPVRIAVGAGISRDIAKRLIDGRSRIVTPETAASVRALVALLPKEATA